MTIKAIETSYQGYRFRSRLEARWAVFMDTMGVVWQYEKEGFDLNGLYYLPDFFLPRQRCWLEIKPVDEGWYRWDASARCYRSSAHPEAPRPSEEFLESLTKAHRLAELSGFPVFMLFADLQPLDCVVRNRTATDPGDCEIVGSNKAWYPDSKHADGCTTWGECPHCGTVGLAHHGQHELCHCQCTERRLEVAQVMRYGGPRAEPYCSFCGIHMEHEQLPHRWMVSRSGQLLDAYAAARSARFEHGQCGATIPPTRSQRP